jgi:hypothetical protein
MLPGSRDEALTGKAGAPLAWLLRTLRLKSTRSCVDPRRSNCAAMIADGIIVAREPKYHARRAGALVLRSEDEQDGCLHCGRCRPPRRTGK